MIVPFRAMSGLVPGIGALRGLPPGRVRGTEGSQHYPSRGTVGVTPAAGPDRIRPRVARVKSGPVGRDAENNDGLPAAGMGPQPSGYGYR
jgi:hypothetical protein